jgi:stage V sporulation protein AD
MGAAMAPAAFETIKAHFTDFNRNAEDYDLIITGDLGQLGKELLLNLCRSEGIGIGGKLADCGTIVFDNTKQDVHSGGSGCGCSAVTLCAYYLDQVKKGKLKRILFCGTGALLSPTSVQQGLPISGVCHAVVIEGGK